MTGEHHTPTRTQAHLRAVIPVSRPDGSIPA